MSRQYVNPPPVPRRHRQQLRAYEPSDNSSGRLTSFANFHFPPSIERNVSHQSTEANPHQHRGRHYSNLPHNLQAPSSFSRVHTAVPTPPRRRYRLEAPSAEPLARHPRWAENTYRTMSHSSDHQHTYRRPIAANPSTSQSHRHDRDNSRRERNSDLYERRQNIASPRYKSPPHLNSQTAEFQPTRPRSTSSFHRPHPHPAPAVTQSSSPRAFFLSDLLQNFIDPHAVSPDSGDDSDSDSQSHSPFIDLIALGWMLQRFGLLLSSDAAGIELHDLFNLFTSDTTPTIGLTDNEIEQIPTMVYRKTSRQRSSSDDKCAVCLSEYTNGEKVKRLQCQHFFHSECIDPWLKTSTQCPICRGEQSN